MASRASVGLLVLSVLFASEVGGNTINTSVGDIVGFHDTWEGKGVYKFRGIPYAEPPTGERRFSPPVAKAPFSSPFVADRFGAPCLQDTAMLRTFFFSNEPQNYGADEDCLSLNIYVPEGGEAKKAVMVLIHGGAYTWGSGMSYDGTKMAVFGDIIIVTVNYRLGVYGFFSTGDKNAAGNYGLLDQQLSLKWVQNNIGAFGGDEDKVTIFGESAGAASVTWQMLAPSNKGLFRRCIAESGAAMCPWSFPLTSVALAYTDKLVKHLNCSSADSSLVLKCMRTVPATTIGYDWPLAVDTEKTPAGPRIDGSFLISSPTCRQPGVRMEDQTFFKSVDLLIGANRYEGSPFNQMMGDPNGVAKAHFTVIAEVLGEIEDSEIVDQLWSSYGGQVSGKLSQKQFLEFLGDAIFYDSIMKFTKRHAAKEVASSGATYMYSFLPMPSEEVRLSPGYIPQVPSYLDGASHGDELVYLFGNATSESLRDTISEAERNLSDAMITYWTNFAKSGNPNLPRAVTYQWKPYETGIEEFIELDIKNNSIDFRTSSKYRETYLSHWPEVTSRAKCMISSGTKPKMSTLNVLAIMTIVSSIMKVTDQ